MSLDFETDSEPDYEVLVKRDHNLKTNERFMANLKKYTDMSDTEVDEFAYSMVALDYFKLPDHSGGAIVPGNKHYRADGTEHTLADVPYRHVLKDLENRIKEQPEDRRTEMCKNVVAGIYGRRRTLTGKERPSIPMQNQRHHSRPLKLYGQYLYDGIARTNSSLTLTQDEPKSNRQLIDDLASAMGMEKRQKGMVQAHIVGQDALGDDKRKTGVMYGGDEGGVVYGGRLGRDHKITDVPNHFFRDEIMDYINRTEVEEDKKQDFRKAVFSDLNSGEIAAYAAFISTTKDEERRKEQEEDDRLEEIMSTHKPRPKSYLEAKNILQQEALVDSIPDDDLDLTKRESHGRTHTYMASSPKSVVKPGSKLLVYEKQVVPETNIDLDCDQIRACIKRFTRGGIWTIDQFRLALGQVARPDLTKFLEKRGSSEGESLRVSGLCWEFFKTRELLGLDMLKSSEDDIKMVEEKGRKRRNPASGDGEPSSKRAGPSTAEWLNRARSVAMGTHSPLPDDADSSSGETSEPIDLTDD